MSQMIEVKTAELGGAALDWAAAEAIGAVHKPGHVIEFPDECPFSWVMGLFVPSSDWRHGGPLIAEYGKSIGMELRISENSASFLQSGMRVGYTASTVLIAACRAIVAARIGDTIAVPAELLP